MNKTKTKFFTICLAATMVGTTFNFPTRTLAVETTPTTVQSISDKTSIKVPGVSVKRITLDNKTDLQVGTGATKTTEQLLATISPANATNKNVSWSSSNTEVATVSATGLVTAVAAGSATITVTSEDGAKKATSKITVKTVTAAIVYVTGVTIDKTTVSDLQAGMGATKTTEQLLATISPVNATNKNIAWSSSDISIATVSTTGLVTAVNAGSATITATSEDGAKIATSEITVTAFTAGNSDQIDSLWTQKWNDEFSGANGTTTDASKWVFDIGRGPNGDGWGNKEQETYTNSTENVYQQDGNLVIAAKKDSSGNITSGRIKTKGSLDMKYGRVDVKAKLPTGTGYWPAIWMLPTDNVYGVWASSGEIDIMENKGRLPNEVYGTLHYGAAWPNNKYTGKTYNFPSGTDVTSFHTYSMEWEPGEIRWYVDGQHYQTQNNWNATDANGEKIAFPAPFDQNFHLILNLAYGGEFDGMSGDGSNIPGQMEVDYVRAYDLTGRPYKTAVEPVVNVETLPEGAKQADSSGNLLSNGDFSAPIKENPTGLLPLAYDWNFVHSTDTGNGTQTIEQIGDTNYAKINVTNAGANNYSVQLMQETTLGTGRWYKLSFDAKTDTNRTIGVKIGGGPSRGYASYADPLTLDLTSEFQSFETTFQMTEETDLAGRIEFELGLSTNPVWIGNARLEEVSAPVQNADASKEPLNDGNRIYNGTFDKGSIDRMAYWNFNVAGAAATASVSEATRELFVDVSDGGTESSAITLTQKGIQLTQNSIYELKFKARAEAPRTIQVGVLSKDGTVNYIEEQTISLTTAMEEKTVSFTMDQPTDLESQIIFKLGGDNNDVYLDDVSLVPTFEFIDYSLVDCYPLKNGDFSRGLESWSPYPNIGDGGASTITAENGEAKISVTAPGPNPYSVMLNQEGFAFTKGVEYLVAFDVRSTVTRNITATIDNKDYDQYLSKTVVAGAEMTHYEFTIKLNQDDTVNLKFLLGNVDAQVPASAHDIFIDNVKVEAINAPFKNPPTLVQSVTNNTLTQPIEVTFSDDAAWTDAITAIKINDTVITSDKYTISAGKITFAADNFPTADDYTIVVIADGYANNTFVQNIKANNLIINNGTFDANVSGWESYIADGSDAVLTSVGGEMKVDFPNYAGWEKWSTQVYQNTIRLEAGKKYVLSFDARSTVARDAWMEMSNMGSQTLALTPTNKNFTYEFTAGATITDGKLNFLLGTSNLDGSLFVKNQSVIIDNVSITENTTSPTVTTAVTVAEGITSVVAPSGDATSLTLPTVPAGYTIAIKTSSNTDIIATNGTITSPAVATTVALVFTVTKTADATTADTGSISVAVPVKTATADLVVNGDFSGTTIDPWTSYSDGGLVVSQVNGEAQLDINGFGNDPWAVQFSQDGFKFEPNVKYTLSFKASGSAPRSFGVDIEGAGYFRYLDKTDNLTSEMKTYTYDFTVTKDETTKMNFFFGKTDINVDNTVPYRINIDDVVITKATTEMPTAVTVAAGITSVAAPSGTATSLSMPAVPAGYTIAIKSSSNPEVIATNGTITSPAAATTVALIFTVTNTADATTADTVSINVAVPAPGETPLSGEVVAVSQTDTTVLNATSAFNVVNGSLVDNDPIETGKSLQTNETAPMSFDFNVNVAASGKYSVTFRVNSTPAGCDLFLISNGITKINVAGPGAVNSTTYTDITREIELKAGEQIISISGIPGSTSTLKIKSITLNPIEIYTPPIIVGDLTAIPSDVPTKLEAENAINVNNATVALNDTVEGGSSLKATDNMSFDFNVDVAVAGQYQITYRTNCAPDGMDIFLKSNGLLLKQAAAPAGGTWGNTTMTVSLDAGPQVLSVSGITGAGSVIQMNYLILTPTGGGSTGTSTSISNTVATVLEAEGAINVTNATVVANDALQGGSSLQSTAPGNPMTFEYNVNVSTAGQYTVTYTKATVGPAGVYFELSKGGVVLNGIGVGPSVTFTDETVTVTLEAGAQVLKVFGAPGESTILKVDKVTIAPVQ